MRVLRSLVFVVIGALAGIVAGVFIVYACLATAATPITMDFALFLTGVAVLIGGIGGGLVAFDCFLHTPSPNSGPLLSPDAERDARARFLPSSDIVVDDASIQPDKRGLKPGDQ